MRATNPQAIRGLTLKLIFLLPLALVFTTAARAQAPATIFQLDGNPASDSQSCAYTTGSTACDYWNLINLTGSSGTGRGHSATNTFLTGGTINFTGGGSKDPSLISSWAYSNTSTPPKDALQSGYAAAYNVSDFDVIFGADRDTPNGDANIGIWFFQQTVATNGTGGFTGAHVKGDVFVISSFTGGGGTSTISVYEWDSACASGVKNPAAGQCADTNLRLIADPTTVCGNSAYCAITNSQTVTATWASYSGNSLVSPVFFEGGIDITQAFASLGQAVPCFSSFLVETRSSQSTTSVLKGFLLGGFNVCSMSISKNCGTSSVNAAGTDFVYPVNGVVTNTGIGTLSNVQVSDCVGGSFNAAGTCSGSLDTLNVSNNTGTASTNPNFGTSTLRAGDTGAWSDSSTTTATMQSDQAFALAATSSGGAQTLQSVNTASQTCSAQSNSTLTISKACSTSLQQAANGTTVGVVVSYGGTVCNTGPSQVTGIALTDYPDSVAITNGTGKSVVASGITLGPAGSATACYTYSPTGTPSTSLTYTPTVIDETISGGTGAGRYFFDDLITISSANATIGTLTQFQNSNSGNPNYNPDPRINGTYGFGTARCPICQGSGECTTP